MLREYKTKESAERWAKKLEKKYKGLKAHIGRMPNGKYYIYMY